MFPEHMIRTIAPIFSLIGLGYVSRWRGLLRRGDEKVLSAYVYYFGLPALIIVDLAGVVLDADALRFIGVSLIPLVVVFAVALPVYAVLRFERGKLILLLTTSIFGSLGFFGLPFVSIALADPGAERLSVLAVSSINTVAFILTVSMLEVHGAGSGLSVLRKLPLRLGRNPLILSIILGLGVSITSVAIPESVADPLHMLGGSTTPVALFMLGAFLYEREYGSLLGALPFVLVRALVLPAVTLFACRWFGLPSLDSAVLVLMYSTPLAVSMMVLSERYGFYPERIAAVILLSSLTAGVYMNLWLLVLG